MWIHLTEQHGKREKAENEYRETLLVYRGRMLNEGDTHICMKLFVV